MVLIGNNNSVSNLIRLMNADCRWKSKWIWKKMVILGLTLGCSFTALNEIASKETS